MQFLGQRIMHIFNVNRYFQIALQKGATNLLFLSSFIENKYNSANTHWVPLTCSVLRYVPWGRSQVNEGRSLPSRSLQSDGWFISRVKGRVIVVERALDWKSILHPALLPTCYMILVKSGFLSGPKFPHLSKESGSFSSDKLWLWEPALPFHTGPSSRVWSKNSRAQASFAHCGTLDRYNSAGP